MSPGLPSNANDAAQRLAMSPAQYRNAQRNTGRPACRSPAARRTHHAALTPVADAERRTRRRPARPSVRPATAR